MAEEGGVAEGVEERQLGGREAGARRGGAGAVGALLCGGERREGGSGGEVGVGRGWVGVGVLAWSERVAVEREGQRGEEREGGFESQRRGRTAGQPWAVGWPGVCRRKAGRDECHANRSRVGDAWNKGMRLQHGGGGGEMKERCSPTGRGGGWWVRDGRTGADPRA